MNKYNPQDDVKDVCRRIRQRKSNGSKDSLYTDFYGVSRNEILTHIILSARARVCRLPSLQEEIIDNYGVLAGCDVDEKFMRSLACRYPDKIKVSFTLGLDEIKITSRRKFEQKF